ncbi:putative aminotransferase [Sarocladium strictum]
MAVSHRKTINLQQGCPTPRLIPTQAIAEASQALLAQPDISQRLMYGPDGGEDHVRASVARWLTDFYHPQAGPITPNRIAITNGASNALSVILQVCTDPVYTRGIWIVEPTYFLARRIWLDAGFGDKMYPVPDHGSGIDLAAWRRRLSEVDREKTWPNTPASKHQSAGFLKVFRHIMYLVPTNSNPIGHTISYDMKVQIVELAREFDILVISDDVYDFLRWPREGNPSLVLEPPMPRLVDIDRSLKGVTYFGNTISNGSFSKIVAPGMRVGWNEASPALIKAIEAAGSTQSGGCQSQFASMVIEIMLSSGQIMNHLQEVLIPTFQKRYHAMVRAIHEFLLPLGARILQGNNDDMRDGTSYVSQAGGYFLYITFPEQGAFLNIDDIVKRAGEDHLLQLAPGHIYQVGNTFTDSDAREPFRHGLRLCWAWHEEGDIVEGIQRLAEVLRAVKTEAN